MKKAIFKINTERTGWVSTVVATPEKAAKHIKKLREKSLECGYNDKYSMEFCEIIIEIAGEKAKYYRDII